MPSLKSIRDLLDDIFDSTTKSLPIDGRIERSHYNQAKNFNIGPTVLSLIYTHLELTRGLIRATTPMYSKYTYVANDDKYRAKIKSDRSLPATAIASGGYRKPRAKLHEIDVDLTARQYSIQRDDVISKLNEWQTEGILDLRPSLVLHVYKVAKSLPQTSTEIETLARAIYAVMKKREEQGLERTDRILQLISGNACFSRKLAEHFGDQLPDGKAECGHCQWCLTHERVNIPIPPPVPFDQLAFDDVLNIVPDRDDPRLLAKVAFGIYSPRVGQLKLGLNPIFGSMQNHEFSVSTKALELFVPRARNH